MSSVASLMVLLAVTVRFGPQTQSHAYYPVNVGDRWQYESSVRGHFENVVEALEGAIARIMSCDDAGRLSYYHVEIRGDSVMQGPDSAHLQLFMDFGVPRGGSFVRPVGSTTQVVTFASHHDTVELFGAEFHDVREYDYRPESGAPYRAYYARGLGLVGIQWETGQSVRLVAAEVGGVRIGRD